jgi:hypothetical protein
MSRAPAAADLPLTFKQSGIAESAPPKWRGFSAWLNRQLNDAHFFDIFRKPIHACLMSTSCCLVAYCPDQHMNVIALVSEPQYRPEGARAWKVTCKRCLKRFAIPEFDLRVEQVFDEMLDHEYGRDSLPTFP